MKTQSIFATPGITLFDGFDAVHEWLQHVKPDVAVVFYNDHGLMWLAARGALHASASKVHSNYHIPDSNTIAGLLLLENAR